MVVGAFLALLVGVTLGLLGGGGSILLLPVLVYVVGIETKSAIATSLLVVGVTSAATLLVHAREGNVRWRTGLAFGSAAMVGAVAGGFGARALPAEALLTGFGVVMLAAALAMMRKRRALRATPSMPKLAATGAGVGAIAGLVGAGGGFLIVPALALRGGLAMKDAIGTSLLVIAMQSLAGFSAYAGHVAIDARLAATISCAALAGSVLGARVARRVSPDALRRGFAWLVLALAVVFLGRQATLYGG